MQTRAPRPLVLLLMIALSSAVQLGGARGVGEAAPWPWASHGPDGGSITALAVDPTNGDVAYAGTAYGGVFATHDAGLHWTSIGSGLPTDNPRIWSITVSPWAPGTVYVGLESADAVYDGESGLWETTDGGASWAEAALGPVPPAHVWRWWTFDWAATRGRHELVVRATDGTGATQPLEQSWNYHGLTNNAAQRVFVTVR